MKIFISYSTHDLETAETVFGDMVRGGADTFQFRRSAIIGKPSWEQVLDWISESDTFIVLISRNALASKPVREEIGHAHHSYMNSDKPGKIVSAIIEKSVKPPRLIERFTTVDFLDYDEGITLLMGQLGLKRKSVAASPLPASFSLPDLSPAFLEFKKKHPDPTPAEVFSKDAETILANYDTLKPGPIKGPDRARHIDLILSGLAGGSRVPKGKASTSLELKDYNKWFLGYDPGDLTLSTPTLADSLLKWKPALSGQPLEAPQLKQTLMGFSWNEVSGATGYALEGSATDDFESPDELYRGPETILIRPMRLTVFRAGGHVYFRVKAVGGVFKPDSAWSNVVSYAPAGAAAPLFGSLLGGAGASLSKLGAPWLQLKMAGTEVRLTWSQVPQALGYRVERAATVLFRSADVVYQGPLTSCTDRPFLALLPTLYYRVRASGLGVHDSDWSNVVICNQKT